MPFVRLSLVTLGQGGDPLSTVHALDYYARVTRKPLAMATHHANHQQYRKEENRNRTLSPWPPASAAAIINIQHVYEFLMKMAI